MRIMFVYGTYGLLKVLSSEQLTIIIGTFPASFPDGPAREQTLNVQFRSTSSWIIAVPEILLVRDYRWEPRRVMLSQGKWKLTMAAAASDLFVV